MRKKYIELLKKKRNILKIIDPSESLPSRPWMSLELLQAALIDKAIPITVLNKKIN